MKRIIPYLLLLLFAVTTNGFAQSWIDQLKTFRDAVYQRDKETAKQFFNYCILHGRVTLQNFPSNLYIYSRFINTQ
ncbi:hypothetical protein [Chitinophaga agri]|uniref:Uncharacterized protein n=1 Tax=Chitinophaga agri TaxID=2703787 RepID=A0A6B9ZKX8_9BACT|nr:hypothetical protein [Chitinophaga agri]QHS62241.1 hypothetical protein GWR21_22320 [Chitinophaga agri]